VAADDAVEFLILPMTHWVSAAKTWLVCRGTVSNCVGIQDSLASAVAQGVRMAEYSHSCGRPAQVHVQESPAAAWRTAWHSPNLPPRYVPMQMPGSPALLS